MSSGATTSDPLYYFPAPQFLYTQFPPPPPPPDYFTMSLQDWMSRPVILQGFDLGTVHSFLLQLDHEIRTVNRLPYRLYLSQASASDFCSSAPYFPWVDIKIACVSQEAIDTIPSLFEKVIRDISQNQVSLDLLYNHFCESSEGSIYCTIPMERPLEIGITLAKKLSGEIELQITEGFVIPTFPSTLTFDTTDRPWSSYPNALFYYCEMLISERWVYEMSPDFEEKVSASFTKGGGYLERISEHANKMLPGVRKSFLRNLERVILCSSHPDREEIHNHIQSLQEPLKHVPPVGLVRYYVDPFYFPHGNWYYECCRKIKREAEKLDDPSFYLINREIQLSHLGANPPQLVGSTSVIHAFYSSENPSWKRAAIAASGTREIHDLILNEPLNSSMMPHLLDKAKKLNLERTIVEASADLRIESYDTLVELVSKPGHKITPFERRLIIDVLIRSVQVKMANPQTVRQELILARALFIEGDEPLSDYSEDDRAVIIDLVSSLVACSYGNLDMLNTKSIKADPQPQVEVVEIALKLRSDFFQKHFPEPCYPTVSSTLTLTYSSIGGPVENVEEWLPKLIDAAQNDAFFSKIFDELGMLCPTLRDEPNINHTHLFYTLLHHMKLLEPPKNTLLWQSWFPMYLRQLSYYENSDLWTSFGDKCRHDPQIYEQFLSESLKIPRFNEWAMALFLEDLKEDRIDLNLACNVLTSHIIQHAKSTNPEKRAQIYELYSVLKPRLKHKGQAWVRCVIGYASLKLLEFRNEPPCPQLLTESARHLFEELQGTYYPNPLTASCAYSVLRSLLNTTQPDQELVLFLLKHVFVETSQLVNPHYPKDGFDLYYPTSQNYLDNELLGILQEDALDNFYMDGGENSLYIDNALIKVARDFPELKEPLITAFMAIPETKLTYALSHRLLMLQDIIFSLNRSNGYESRTHETAKTVINYEFDEEV